MRAEEEDVMTLGFSLGSESDVTVGSRRCGDEGTEPVNQKIRAFGFGVALIVVGSGCFYSAKCCLIILV